LTDHPQEFGFGLKPGDPRVVAAQRHLEKMTADFKRLTELQEVRSAAWQTGIGCAGERRGLVEARQARQHHA
jgi:hypothetical protein